jgi:7-cyano-7-deazaguanine tRNA-ribosyltransferase
VSFTLVHDDWPETALSRVPEEVRLRDLHARE